MATRGSGSNNGSRFIGNPLTLAQGQSAVTGRKAVAPPTPIAATASVPSTGRIPNFATPAQHAEMARQHSRLAAAHSARAAALSRDQQKTLPKSQRTR